MKKVAFLLLTDSDFVRMDIWRKFFDSKEKRWNLYVHSKNGSEFNWIKNRQIKTYVNTGWADFSLVEAENELLKEALGDMQNEAFVLISESHCPLYNITETIDKILSMDLPVFSSESGKENLEFRWKRSNFESVSFLDKDYFDFSSQWWIFNRETANYFAKTKDHFRKYFQRTSFADEHYHISLCNYEEIKFSRLTTTYANWKIPTADRYCSFVKRKKPKTYFKIKKSFIRKLRKNGCLFFRKVSHLTMIDTEYLFNSD